MTIFQKIIDGEIPAHKIYEDDKTLAFLDIYPASEGHCLIIPKQAVDFVWNMDDAEYNNLMTVSKKVAQRMLQVMPQKHVHMSIVGTDIAHAHVHLIPFNNSKDFHNDARMEQEPDHQKLAELAKKLYFTDEQ